jgi:hypothetical protein
MIVVANLFFLLQPNSRQQDLSAATHDFAGTSGR